MKKMTIERPKDVRMQVCEFVYLYVQLKNNYFLKEIL